MIVSPYLHPKFAFTLIKVDNKDRNFIIKETKLTHSTSRAFSKLSDEINISSPSPSLWPVLLSTWETEKSIIFLHSKLNSFLPPFPFFYRHDYRLMLSSLRTPHSIIWTKKSVIDLNKNANSLTFFRLLLNFHFIVPWLCYMI